MSRKLTIADQIELDSILDSIPEYKRAEAVAYLQSVHGIENEAEYFVDNKYEYLDLFDECEIVEYYGDELLSEYEVKQLMTWIDLEDIRNKYGLADYIEYYVKNWHKKRYAYVYW